MIDGEIQWFTDCKVSKSIVDCACIHCINHSLSCSPLHVVLMFVMNVCAHVYNMLSISKLLLILLIL